MSLQCSKDNHQAKKVRKDAYKATIKEADKFKHAKEETEVTEKQKEAQLAKEMN